MVATADLYPFAQSLAFQGKINWLTDTIKGALVGAGYTPNLTTDEFWSTPQANEISGTGYTAGGVALASLTAVTTAANSWGVNWAATTAYTVGQIIKPVSGNGFLYRAATSGTSGGSTPSFPTVVGETVTDSGVIWTNVGTSITVYSSAPVIWSTATLTASYLVIYDAQTGVAATEPLVDLQTFASSTSSTGGTFEVTPDAVHGWFYTTSS